MLSFGLLADVSVVGKFDNISHADSERIPRGNAEWTSLEQIDAKKHSLRLKLKSEAQHRSETLSIGKGRWAVVG